MGKFRFLTLYTGNSDLNIDIQQAYYLDGISICDSLFSGNKPVREQYQDYLQFKGVKRVLADIKNGCVEEKDKELAKEIKNAIAWVENGCKDPIKMELNVDADDYDFLKGFYNLICYTKVMAYLQKNRKGEFEYFEVDFINYTGNKKYYVINSTTPNFSWKFVGDFKGLK